MSATVPSSTQVGAVEPIESSPANAGLANDPAAISTDAANAASVDAAPADAAAAPETTGDAEQLRDPKTGRFAERTQQFQSQISALRAEKGALERQTLELRRTLETQQQRLQAPTKVDPNDYDAVERQRLESVMDQRELRQTAAMLQHTEQQATQAKAAQFHAKVDLARERIPTLDQDLANFARLPLSPEAADVIAESDRAPDIAVWLSRNVQEAYRIAALPVHRQAAEIARIEARVSSTPIKRISTAPAPLQTASGAASSHVPDPSKMDFKDYEKWRASGNG